MHIFILIINNVKTGALNIADAIELFDTQTTDFISKDTNDILKTGYLKLQGFITFLGSVFGIIGNLNVKFEIVSDVKLLAFNRRKVIAYLQLVVY